MIRLSVLIYFKLDFVPYYANYALKLAELTLEVAIVGSHLIECGVVPVEGDSNYLNMLSKIRVLVATIALGQTQRLDRMRDVEVCPISTDNEQRAIGNISGQGDNVNDN